MARAALWGLIGGSSLLLGAAIGLRWMPGQRQIGLIMAFGAGVLVSAVAFELTEEAFGGGFDAVGIGLALGAIAFTAGDAVIERCGGDRKRSPVSRKVARPWPSRSVRPSTASPSQS